MLSHSADLRLTHRRLLQTLNRSKYNRRRTLIPIDSPLCNRRFGYSLKLSEFCDPWRGSTTMRRNLFRIGNMDEDSGGISSLDEWGLGESEEISDINSYMLSASEGEDSDVEITQILVNPSRDVDLPNARDHLEDLDSSDGTIMMTADRLGVLRKRRRVYKIRAGVFITMGLVAFLVMLLLFVDWCSWRIVRLPLESFFLTRPFFYICNCNIILRVLICPIT